ncbi:MAG: substrate-binding domain-containing protein [Elainellaceae cyanobacterium]
MTHPRKRRSLLISLGIIAIALGATYVPVFGSQQRVVVVSGTELEEPLERLEQEFEKTHPSIQIDLQFQGSQDIVNSYINDQSEVDPAILIPANGELLDELSDRWQVQHDSDPFYEPPRPIVKTMLVGIAWAERGEVLFPTGAFDWSRLQTALEADSWSQIGGSADWGSFDFVMTDPTRSNSGQLTLSLWAQANLGGDRLNSSKLNDSSLQSLIGLIKRSVYLPPPSTDILLQEFIARGPNEADVATVYESIALHRWQQSSATQGQPYQIYYLDPAIETISTAAIVRRNINAQTADAAQQFLDFLTDAPQQAVFIQYGFRPGDASMDLQSVPESPWSQNIPGAEIDPAIQLESTPDRQTLSELIRLWQRAN